MELPISVVFEPPSRVQLRALLRRRRLWVAAGILALGIGSLLVVARVSRAEAQAAAGSALLIVTSRPLGANVAVDGQARGHTPAHLLVPPGTRRITLNSDTAAETTADYSISVGVEGSSLDVLLWRRDPFIRRVRPSMPGARLDGVHLLADGQLALVTRTPSTDAELRAWRLDPLSGSFAPLSEALSARRLALTPDGMRVAFVGRDVGPLAARSWLKSAGSAFDASAGVVWRAPEIPVPDAASRGLWRTPPGEQLIDVAWSPSGETVLVVTASALADGTQRSRLFALGAYGEPDARELIALPSGVVPGAYAWSPDGRRVVFVAHAGGLNALCLLDLHGEFRYLADLDRSDTPPLPYLPVAWSTDSRRLVFVAPRQQAAPTESWLSRQPRRAVYLAEVDTPDPRLLAELDVDVPAWREDGRILLVSRERDDGTLAIQLLAESGAARELLRLPLRVGERYAATWSTRHGQLLVADATRAQTDYWFVGLGLEQPS